MDIDRSFADLHDVLGFKRLSRARAKAEILLGLTAAATGILLAQWGFSVRGGRSGWALAILGGVLVVLGEYIAMVGHRSHIYHSQNMLTAYLARLVGDAGRSGGDSGPE